MEIKVHPNLTEIGDNFYFLNLLVLVQFLVRLLNNSLSIVVLKWTADSSNWFFLILRNYLQMLLKTPHPIETVQPNGPKIRQKCTYEKKYFGVQQVFCQKS